ncbi:hypothetical protein GGX14DRAFT_676380 [Mycena pura]|uniref:Cyanovirin-N domain-containing protein n=1 Tax=Mycena pura TaxID=153505 RepID=A0AAD6VT20_9AGAR|nr:hypothetical protein GGX14DRAFT_676380 [Mycena pura]
MSVSTTSSKAGIAQPVINTGELFSESKVVKGGAAFSEQQSVLSRQSSFMTQSSQSFQRQDSSYSSYTDSSAYEYHRTRLTLADCQLELKMPILTIKPKSSGAQFNLTTLNLDDHLGNVDGELVWGYQKISASCKNVTLKGTLLVASCERGNKESLDLTEYITYSSSRRCFEAILPDPGFLTNPAFQESIQTVARRAVEEVTSEMLKYWLGWSYSRGAVSRRCW